MDQAVFLFLKKQVLPRILSKPDRKLEGYQFFELNSYFILGQMI